MNKHTHHHHDHEHCDHDHHEHHHHDGCGHDHHHDAPKPNYEPDVLPAIDPDVAENKITMTAAAIAHVNKYLEKHNNALGLRLRVKKSGCSGLTYLIEYAEQKSDNDFLFTIDDKITVYVDNVSFPYLKGTCVDYKQIGISGGMLKCVNPNETNSCGCGESFSVN